ncbi:MAG: flagellar biosynthetic protein FliR [Candidatus Marinimicrobia bacterium]|nr:flagellar biosynthetic protein FliR [Candidatus Neomarinimicrobiota bacterium]
MFEIIDQLENLLPGYMLVFARISGLLISLPILSSPLINKKTKVLMTILFTFIIAPGLTVEFPEVSTLSSLVILIVVEVFVGLTIGFGTLVIFESFNMIGAIMGRQMGLFMARAINPMTRQQSNVVSPFLTLILIVYFLVTNSHYIFIRTIFENFRVIPIGMATFPGSQGRTMIATGSTAYHIAIKFAGPTIIFLLLLQIATAFSVRVMPQMNVMFVMLPLRIGCGLFALMTSLKIFQLIFDSFYNDIFQYINTTLMHLKGA